MRAYRARKRAAGLRKPTGWVAGDVIGAGVWSDHRILEARSLAMHCLAVLKIQADPSLLEIPRRNVARWKRSSTQGIPGYLAEWEEILERPWPEIASLVTSLSSRAVELRQSSPFAGVLDVQERKRIYDAFRT